MNDKPEKILKRFTLFLQSSVALGGVTTANTIQFDLSTLNQRIQTNKRMRMSCAYFTFFDVAVSGAHHVAFSVSIPEFVQDGLLITSNAVINETLSQSQRLFLLPAQGQNTNLSHQGNGFDWVEGYFSTNLITVKIDKLPATDATTLNAGVNWAMHLTLDELE